MSQDALPRSDLPIECQSSWVSATSAFISSSRFQLKNMHHMGHMG